jgi:hypothetical protein
MQTALKIEIADLMVILSNLSEQGLEYCNISISKNENKLLVSPYIPEAQQPSSNGEELGDLIC